MKIFKSINLRTPLSLRGFLSMTAALLALNVLSGCESDPPEACFSVSANLVDQNEDVFFTNCSKFQKGGYTWDFGNGITSNNTSPVAKFTSQGEFLVSLTAKGSTSATDDVITEIIKVGKRILRDIRITNYPANDPLTNQPWDAGDLPDLKMALIKNGVAELTTPVNTNMAIAIPYTIDLSSANFDLTPSNWLLALLDDDGTTSDTIAKTWVNLATMVPNAEKSISDDYTAAVDFTLSYTIR
jgi:PKD repeat protein